MWLVEVSTASVAGRGPVAQAVARRAEVRAALDHAPRDVRAGPADVVARSGVSMRGFSGGAQQGLSVSSEPAPRGE